LFYGAVLSLGYLVFLVFQPFLVPLGWAAVFAVIFHSVQKMFEPKWGRATSAALITAAVTLILIVPVLFLATMFVREGMDAARNLQAEIAGGGFAWFNRAWSWLVSHLAAEGMTLDFPDLVRRYASRVGETMAGELGAVVRNIAVFLFELVVTLFALFYFLRDGDRILDRFRHLLPFREAMTERMLTEARELIFASVTTSLVIAAVQGTLCGGAFAIVGLGSPFFWGVVMGFLSLLPVVGAWPVWVPATIWLFSTGRWGRGILLIAICGALGAAIDNILRPALLGGRTSLNGLLIFISVLGGIAVFGILGIVLGPIVVATSVGILDVYSGMSEAENTAGAPSP
jgi:predicted PurR-regulated permease PerM